MMTGTRTKAARRRICTSALALAIGLAVSWAAVPAMAQPVPAEQSELADDADDSMPWAAGVPIKTRRQARRLFLAGNDLLKEALFAHAAAQYEEALRLWDHPAIHYNLALAQINLGRPIEAHATLTRALRYGAAPLGQDKHEHARSYLKLVEQQLGRIHILCNEPGAEVSLDGALLFVGPGRRELMVRTGAHQVLVTKAGRVPTARQVHLGAGEHAEVAIEPQTLPELLETRRWPMWKPWAVVGAGALAGAAGGLLHWRAAGNVQAFDRAFHLLPCATGSGATDVSAGCRRADIPDALDQQLERATWQQRIAVGLYAAGGIALVTGLSLAYMNRAQLVRAGGVDSGAEVAPLVSSDVLGMSARIRF